MSKYDRHKEICKELNDLYKSKNQDYGDSFSIMFEKRGFNYVLPRLEEKIMRIETVAEKGNLVDESIRDSLIDLANYAIMTVIEVEAKEG